MVLLNTGRILEVIKTCKFSESYIFKFTVNRRVFLKGIFYGSQLVQCLK